MNDWGRPLTKGDFHIFQLQKVGDLFGTLSLLALLGAAYFLISVIEGFLTHGEYLADLLRLVLLSWAFYYCWKAAGSAHEDRGKIEQALEEEAVDAG